MIRSSRPRPGLGLALKACCATALAIAGSAAPAQLAPGYSGHPGIRYMGEEEVWYAIRQLGDCLARSRQAASAALLSTTPGTPAETAATRRLLGHNTSCLQPNSRMAAPRNIIRGAVAEGMYRNHFGAPPPAEPIDPEADADRPPLPLLVDFATCFAQVRPQSVHDLLTTTRLGTRAEHEAFARLAPELGQCLTAGVRFQFGAPLIRLALAEALYQRTLRVRPLPQGARQ